MLLDGAHLVAAALDARVPIEAVVTDGRHRALAAAAERAGATLYEAGPRVFDAVSPVRSPAGVVAIARWAPAPAARLLAGAPMRLLGLLGVQDPGNVGSAIRTADALGASGVIGFDGSAHPAGVKALRGAMGSTFRLPVATGASADAVAEARRRDWRIYAAVADASTAIEDVNLAVPALVLLGSEGAGLPEGLRDAADTAIRVPMRAGVESLNVAVTAALIVAEARRQRVAHPR